tara:strand:+ start:2409 stop:2840 length:432 start_codon:yes stop_codon:yes gene_type:complete
MRLIFKFLNPIVIALLNSPLHFIFSNKIMVITFFGRRSGKEYRTPVSYMKNEKEIICVTSIENVWWKNFQTESRVFLQIRGNSLQAKALSIINYDEVKQGLTDILNHSPVDSFFAGVRLSNGVPRQDDIDKVSHEHVLMKIKL